MTASHLRYLRFAAPLGLMGLLYWSSSHAWSGADVQLYHWLPTWVASLVPVDKVLHWGAYGVLAGLWLWALEFRRAWLAWCIPTAFGAFDEWHQSQVPGRTSDPGDVVADALGAATLLALWWAFSAWKKRPRP